MNINYKDNSPINIRSILSLYLKLCIPKIFIKAEEEGCYYIPYESKESKHRNEEYIKSETKNDRIEDKIEINLKDISKKEDETVHIEDNLNSSRELKENNLDVTIEDSQNPNPQRRHTHETQVGLTAKVSK